MRKNFLAVVLVFFVVGFVSCKKENTSNSKENKHLISSGMYLYDEILDSSGSLHNALLDSLVIIMDSHETFDSAAYESSMNQFASNLTSTYGGTPYLNYFANNNSYRDNTYVLDSMRVELESSPFLGNVFLEVKQLLDNVSDREGFKTGLLEIYSNNTANCPDEYRAGFVAMISIAYSSFQYWQNNYNEWTDRAIMITFDAKSDAEAKRKKQEIREARIKDFIQTDLAAAAVGGMFGGLPGAVGTGAICSAIVALSWKD